MLNFFGCSNEEEALKAEARGLEEKQIQAEEKVVQLNNELNVWKQKYAGVKVGFEHLSLENSLCEHKAREQTEQNTKRINELTSLLKSEVAKVEQLTKEKAVIEKDSKRDYSRLGTLEGLDLQKRIDQSQFEDAMEQKQNAIEEMNRLRANLTDLEHQLMYANMQLHDKEVLLQDIPPLHMNILTLKNQLQQAQSHIIGDVTVNQWNDELNSKNMALERLQYQLEKMTAINAEHERLFDVQQKQALTDAQEIVELRRQSLRVADLEHQLVTAKRDGDSAQQLTNELSVVTTAKAAAVQEVRKHLATIDDFMQSAAKESNGDVSRWKKAHEEMSVTKAVADHNVSLLTTQAHSDREEIVALQQTIVEFERQSKIAVDESGKDLNDLRTQLRMKEGHESDLGAQLRIKETRINELASLIATLTAQYQAAENSITSLTKQRQFDQELLASNRRELDDANSVIRAMQAQQQQKSTAECILLKKQLMEMTAAKEAIEAQSARDHDETLLNSKQSSKANVDTLATLHAENAAAFRAELAQKEDRVVALGKMQLSDKAIIDELRSLLDASNKKQQALEDQLAATKAEPATPTDASKPPLERSRSPSDMIPPKDHDVIPPSNSPVPKHREPRDIKRLKDLELINNILLSFARDSEFQQDLTRPLVRVAVDLWKGVSTSSHADMESAKFDAGVIRIYPKLKAFEQQCASAGLDQFPIDHVEARRTELSAEAVTKSFGSHFVSNYYLNRAVNHSSP